MLFSDEQNRLALIAKVFGHPARVAIVQHLLENRTCMVSNLTEALPLSQSTISQHLKELKNVGLIKGEIEGPSISYCLNLDTVKEIIHMLNQFNNELGGCCQ